MPKRLRLGDALARRAFERRSSLWRGFRACARGSIEDGAGDETRTRDINLGKGGVHTCRVQIQVTADLQPPINLQIQPLRLPAANLSTLIAFFMACGYLNGLRSAQRFPRRRRSYTRT
jgi:hypothetical protein